MNTAAENYVRENQDDLQAEWDQLSFLVASGNAGPEELLLYAILSEVGFPDQLAAVRN